MAKTKRVKTRTKKVKAKIKSKKRMSKGAKTPWEVWHIDPDWEPRFHSIAEEFKTEAKAKAYLKKHPYLVAPVIHHVDIPPMEY